MPATNTRASNYGGRFYIELTNGLHVWSRTFPTDNAAREYLAEKVRGNPKLAPYYAGATIHELDLKLINEARAIRAELQHRSRREQQDIHLWHVRLAMKFRDTHGGADTYPLAVAYLYIRSSLATRPLAA
jgi:hypothetical protein